MTPADIAEKERIADRFRQATSRANLVQIASEERQAKAKLEKRPKCAIFGIHLKNLLLIMQVRIVKDQESADES